jgi:hypothetical protein
MYPSRSRAMGFVPPPSSKVGAMEEPETAKSKKMSLGPPAKGVGMDGAATNRGEISIIASGLEELLTERKKRLSAEQWS